MTSSGYPGSKAGSGVFHKIIGQMPPHTVYVEPFYGSGQVFLRKRRAARNVLIDISPAAIARAPDEPGVRRICGNAFAVIPLLDFPRDAVVYADPPYVLSTRKNRRYYQHELTDAQHRLLLELLRGLRCRVMISGYTSEIYSSQLRSWRCVSYRARTRGRTVTECLWCNFPEPSELHDWRYAGKSYRERLTLKRLAARWLLKLERMNERKRGYLLTQISQRHSDLLKRI